MNIEILGKIFDDEKIKKGSKQYDQKCFEEYRNYLLSIPEIDVVKMDIKHAYERIRFISAKEQPELLRKAGFNPNPHQEEKTQPRGYKGASMVYKNWAGE